MANDTRIAIKFTTPKGVADYPKLNRPDTKFQKEGEYSVKLYMDPTKGPVKCEIQENGKPVKKMLSIEDFEKVLDTAFDEAVKNGRKATRAAGAKTKIEPGTKPYGWNDNFDDDGKLLERTEKDGPRLFYINAKMKAAGISQKTNEPYEQKPTIFDCAKPPKDITNVCPNIGSGSILIVGAQAVEFLHGKMAGLTIRLQAVQVVEIKAGSRDADSFGFDGEEGGFVDDGTAKPAEKAPAKKPVEMDDEDSDGDEPSDDDSEDDDDSGDSDE